MLGRVHNPFLSRSTPRIARLASTAAPNRIFKGFSGKYEVPKKGDNAPLIATVGCSTRLSNEGVRRVSTAPSQLKNSKAPGNPELPVVSGSFLDVKLPVPEVNPEPLIQVPYVPDFWDSAKLAPETMPAEVPKVVVVGGTETHHGGGPSHALEDVNVPVEKDSSQTPVGYSQSFLDDIAEDLQLPPVQEIKNSFRKLFS